MIVSSGRPILFKGTNTKMILTGRLKRLKTFKGNIIL